MAPTLAELAGAQGKYQSFETALESPTDTHKRFEEWLPVTGSRNAKWYYSAFHNITAMVGAGVLGLPHAMAIMQWSWGTVVLLLSWSITLYTLWQLVELHEAVEGKRFDRYHELAQEAFGERLGLWILVPQQLVVEFGLGVVYTVTGGQSLLQFYTLACAGHECVPVSKTQWIIIFSCLQLLISQLPNFNSISAISFAAAIMSICYSTIAFGASLAQGPIPNVSYAPPPNTPTDHLLNVFNALGIMAFAYGGHNVALEIQATIPSTPSHPSKTPMWHGVLVAYALVAWCYFSVAFAGYYAFGNRVSGNVLVSVGHPPWLIAAAHLMVFVHVVGSFQVFTMPVFDMIESTMLYAFNTPPTLALRLVTRSIYVVLTCVVAATVPFFEALLGFLGGFAFAPTTFFLPCIMWMRIKKPKRFSLVWFINYLVIVLGVLLMILACIGGGNKLISDLSSNGLYQ